MEDRDGHGPALSLVHRHVFGLKLLGWSWTRKVGEEPGERLVAIIRTPLWEPLFHRTHWELEQDTWNNFQWFLFLQKQYWSRFQIFNLNRFRVRMSCQAWCQEQRALCRGVPVPVTPCYAPLILKLPDVVDIDPRVCLILTIQLIRPQAKYHCNFNRIISFQRGRERQGMLSGPTVVAVAQLLPGDADDLSCRDQCGPVAGGSETAEDLPRNRWVRDEEFILWNLLLIVEISRQTSFLGTVPVPDRDGCLHFFYLILRCWTWGGFKRSCWVLEFGNIVCW